MTRKLALGVIAKLIYTWNDVEKYLIVYTDGIDDCVMMLDDDKEEFDNINVGDILERCEED